MHSMVLTKIVIMDNHHVHEVEPVISDAGSLPAPVLIGLAFSKVKYMMRSLETIDNIVLYAFSSIGIY